MMPWMWRNAGSRLRFALRHPSYTLGSLWKEVFRTDERFLAEATGAPASRLRTFLNEPFGSREFSEHLNACHRKLSTAKIYSADLFAKKVLLQYALVRALQPATVVETGVANGVSSFFLLLALEKNGRGQLHSIEVGDTAYLPPGCPVGWVVPESLRKRWCLHLGDSAKLLPALLAQLGTIDIFVHDSLHTYEHMTFELECAFPFVRRGGFLVVDDALWNKSFDDFSGKVLTRYARILRGVGFLRKDI